MTAAITPSPQQAAVWEALKEGKNGTIRFNAFGKAIADELQRRLAGFGLDKLGCEASTFHSMGYKAVNANVGYCKPNKYAVIDMVSTMLGQDFRDLKRDPKLLMLVNAVDKLVGLCKQNLSDSDPESLDKLTSHYDVDVGDIKSTAYSMVPEVLEKCKDPKGSITFDDMVWLPVVLDLPIAKADTLLVDESQDLNQMKQSLAYKSGQRIVFVGDPNQAIFGFAGADSESMNRMHSYLEATPVGCQVLPLTVTRRCGRAIVKEANVLVPELEAHESNPEGEVVHAKYDSKHPQYYGKDVQDGDFLICRCNAPLISQCFKFLREGRKATIMGRDIGEGLISTVRRMKANTVPELIGALSDWKTQEEAKELAKRMPSDIKLINIHDKYDCLVAFSEGAQTIEDIVNKVQIIFTDDPHKPGIRLASGHKSKGLEAQRVVLLMPKYAPCPHPMAKSAWQREQELHILYVMQTRAISKLTYASE
jgi:superfamily I DNA/RNA helicase